MNQLDISIIVPIFNEEGSINELYNELSSSIPHNLDYEIIFINDGSQDDSSKKIQSIILKDKKVKLVIGEISTAIEYLFYFISRFRIF